MNLRTFEARERGATVRVTVMPPLAAAAEVMLTVDQLSFDRFLALARKELGDRPELDGSLPPQIALDFLEDRGYRPLMVSGFREGTGYYMARVERVELSFAQDDGLLSASRVLRFTAKQALVREERWGQRRNRWVPLGRLFAAEARLRWKS